MMNIQVSKLKTPTETQTVAEPVKTGFAALWRPALVQAFVKLDPRQLARSPVMLVVELTAILTTILCVIPDPAVSTGVAVQIALWLWFTVLFANFAEALAEGHGKAQAASLKKSRTSVIAKKLAFFADYPEYVAIRERLRSEFARELGWAE